MPELSTTGKTIYKVTSHYSTPQTGRTSRVHLVAAKDFGEAADKVTEWYGETNSRGTFQLIASIHDVSGEYGSMLI